MSTLSQIQARGFVLHSEVFRLVSEVIWIFEQHSICVHRHGACVGEERLGKGVADLSGCNRTCITLGGTSMTK